VGVVRFNEVKHFWGLKAKNQFPADIYYGIESLISGTGYWK
jgi:hypothetical protein